MTQLSKYALKQLTDEERVVYFAELETEDKSYTLVAKGLQANTFTYCPKCGFSAYADIKHNDDNWTLTCHHCKQAHVRKRLCDTPKRKNTDKRKERLEREKRIFEYIEELEEAYKRLAPTHDLRHVWLQNAKREFDADMDDFDYGKIGDDDDLTKPPPPGRKDTPCPT